MTFFNRFVYCDSALSFFPYQIRQPLLNQLFREWPLLGCCFPNIQSIHASLQTFERRRSLHFALRLFCLLSTPVFLHLTDFQYQINNIYFVLSLRLHGFYELLKLLLAICTYSLHPAVGVEVDGSFRRSDSLDRKHQKFNQIQANVQLKGAGSMSFKSCELRKSDEHFTLLIFEFVDLLYLNNTTFTNNFSSFSFIPALSFFCMFRLFCTKNRLNATLFTAYLQVYPTQQTHQYTCQCLPFFRKALQTYENPSLTAPNIYVYCPSLHLQKQTHPIFQLLDLNSIYKSQGSRNSLSSCISAFKLPEFISSTARLRFGANGLRPSWQLRREQPKRMFGQFRAKWRVIFGQTDRNSKWSRQIFLQDSSACQPKFQAILIFSGISSKIQNGSVTKSCRLSTHHTQSHIYSPTDRAGLSESSVIKDQHFKIQSKPNCGQNQKHSSLLAPVC